MSEQDATTRGASPTTGRLPQVAIALALIAVGVAGAAAIVVVRRGDTDAVPAPAAPVAAEVAPSIIEQQVDAADIVALRDSLANADDSRGVRVTDDALSARLGLVPDDVITALAGRVVSRTGDVTDVIFRADSLRLTTLYVDIERGAARTPVVVRWRIEGSLLAARRAAMTAGLSNAQPAPNTFGPALKNPFTGTPPDDALLDTIERVDSSTYRVPRSTFQALLADAHTHASGARVAPAKKRGVLVGYRLYAVRRDSMFARLGLENGDVIVALNGEKTSELDDVIAFFVNARRAAHFTVDLERRGQPHAIRIEITK